LQIYQDNERLLIPRAIAQTKERIARAPGERSSFYNIFVKKLFGISRTPNAEKLVGPDVDKMWLEAEVYGPMTPNINLMNARLRQKGAARAK
jgi:hypothetical protein